ncbi:amino acid ABC transporter permease [Helicobacter sp. faydin-H76]|uniref:Amino acid ABC transporter permease n=2 Tax=Helicobacter cappadocius TaxID=3063998 RepID=A0AA90T9D9_9HELI|nr:MULTISPECIES: amino acid ABC transporter permease [unclassified Helicobacter]MDO7253112.1 amino acid ABC transporter permease [Helicobacter sp. faydin-H75]MDP2538762.1 amino acid ABC transporter permease [Helicobacter sp. faydin-H76]
MMNMMFLFEPNTILRFAHGIFITLYVSIISIIIAILGGIVMGIIMASKSTLATFLCRLYLESIRIIPILAWLFIVYFGLSTLSGVHINALTASILVFGLWGIAEMGDLTRGALTSIALHQTQSAKAIGLNRIQIAVFVIFPQAFLRLLPSSINLFTRMIKTTSLLALIGVIDLLKVGQQIIEANILKIPDASFWVYGAIFIIYFFLCYPLSILSKKLEAKIS